MQTKRNALYYGAWAAVLLLTEIFIGAYVSHTLWLRSYGGDILVIPLIYVLTRIFVRWLPRTMPLVMGGVGLLAELAQLFRLSDRLGFARGSLPAVIIGTSFSWVDVLCYAAGVVLIYIGMWVRSRGWKPLTRIVLLCWIGAAFWDYTVLLPLSGGEIPACVLGIWLTVAAVCLTAAWIAVHTGHSGYGAFGAADVLLLLLVILAYIVNADVHAGTFEGALIGVVLVLFTAPYLIVLLIGDLILYRRAHYGHTDAENPG